MLALATPALHDHSHALAVPGPASKTSIVRSKPATRRAPSSSSLPSSSLPSATPSSSSSSSLAPTLVPSNSSRSSVPPVSQPRTTSTVQQQPTTQPEQSSSRPTTQQRQQNGELPPGGRLEDTDRLLASPGPTQPPDGPAPVDINSYPTSDLLKLLASLLTQIATANDGLSTSLSNGAPDSHTSHSGARPPIWQTLFTASRTALSTPTSPLAFHARNIPSITLEAYLFRILRYCPTTNEVFLSLLVYFDRMSKLAQEATGSRFMIDSYNVHRLVIAGVTVASKFFSDVFYTNSRYAKVGGLPQAELNQLELQFLLLNDFRLSIPNDEMQRYADQLVRFAQSRNGLANGQLWLSPVMTESRTLAASRPMQSMGAFDAFGGAIGGTETIADGEAPRNSTPRRSTQNGIHTVAATVGMPEELEERDPDSSVYSETDTEAETSTDDEPTIRASHSCASSDTQSLFSNDASEDGHSSFDMHGDEEDEGPPTDDESYAGGFATRRPTHFRWNSSASSVDDHANT